MKDTSKEAYKKILDKLGERQQEVYQAIREYPGHTDQELAAILAYDDPNKVRPRRKELFDLGFIKDSGVKSCQITKHNAHTWTLTSFDGAKEGSLISSSSASFIVNPPNKWAGVIPPSDCTTCGRPIPVEDLGDRLCKFCKISGGLSHEKIS